MSDNLDFTNKDRGLKRWLSSKVLSLFFQGLEFGVVCHVHPPHTHTHSEPTSCSSLQPVTPERPGICVCCMHMPLPTFT